MIATKERIFAEDECHGGCFGLAVVREGNWVLFLGCVASVCRCCDGHG